ncbi:MAG: hypothetical protein K8R73_12870 [Clostridiales bacterium]|nr:hypothetical protein [Clostridiales bacterium]
METNVENENLRKNEVNDQNKEKEINPSDNVGMNIYDSDYIDRRILQLESDLESDISTTKGMKIFFGLLTFISVFEFTFKLLNWNNVIMVILITTFGLFFAASYSTGKQMKIKSELQLLSNKKSSLNDSIKMTQSSKHFDSLVRININNLEEYYNLVKRSNSRSFNVSLSMSLMGIVLIFCGIIYSYFSVDKNNISYLVAASGIVVELLSGLLFYLYNKTVVQLKEYHDSLLDVQNVLLSFKLIDELENEEYKSDIMKQMIEFIIKR